MPYDSSEDRGAGLGLTSGGIPVIRRDPRWVLGSLSIDRSYATDKGPADICFTDDPNGIAAR
jgi:hypothetical protein